MPVLKNHKITLDCFSSMNARHAELKSTLLGLLGETASLAVNEPPGDTPHANTAFAAAERKWAAPFLQSVTPHMDTMCQQLMMGRWDISEAWFVEYEKNNYAQWHVHPKCMWTNVYYLSLPEESPITTFLSLPSGEEIEVCNIEEGMIVSFPSAAIHCSRPNQSDIPKTVIAFNSDLYDPTIHEKFPMDAK